MLYSKNEPEYDPLFSWEGITTDNAAEETRKYRSDVRGAILQSRLP